MFYGVRRTIVGWAGIVTTNLAVYLFTARTYFFTWSEVLKQVEEVLAQVKKMIFPPEAEEICLRLSDISV